MRAALVPRAFDAECDRFLCVFHFLGRRAGPPLNVECVGKRGVWRGAVILFFLLAVQNQQNWRGKVARNGF